MTEKTEPYLGNLERQLRIKCVELAVKSPLFVGNDTDIINVAQKIYWFITAKDE
jgi:hypothetical protein